MATPPRELRLSTGAVATVDGDRLRVDLPPSWPGPCHFLSSAVLNGGFRSFDAADDDGDGEASSPCHVLNHRVPSTYDGVHPPALRLLSNLARKEGLDPDRTVGLLTAASMETVRVASRSGKGARVDVVATVGLSNARSAGAPADYFGLCDEEDDDEDEDEDGATTTPGTINTIVIVDVPLTPAARVEAFAIAIEAKCAACVDHGVPCAKDAAKFAMGTGTDCCVLASPGGRAGKKRGAGAARHAGKHTLLAELIGQAVHEATSAGIMANVRHVHGGYARYKMHQWGRAAAAALRGARPRVPPRPMDPIPAAPASVLLAGAGSVLAIYLAPLLPDGARLLLGAAAWDRYLGEPPLRAHPVCLAGSAISACLSGTPERAFRRPALGFGCGLAFLSCMAGAFWFGARAFVSASDAASALGPTFLADLCGGRCRRACLESALNLLGWILKLLLLKSAFSLQLLCALALQMATFLERDRVDEARAQLSWLCSRDPMDLGPSDLAGATLESLAENLSDGFVAPLFWYVLAGPEGAVAYRVVNTLDSRVGYRGRYEWFGKPSARVDDVLNLVPARLTALLLACAAALVPGCRGGAGRGLRTAWDDRRKCESPNAGWPMACMAGILGVRLRKEGAYCLGATGSEPGPRDVLVGYEVAQVAGGMAVVLVVIAGFW